MLLTRSAFLLDLSVVVMASTCSESGCVWQQRGQTGSLLLAGQFLGSLQGLLVTSCCQAQLFRR